MQLSTSEQGYRKVQYFLGLSDFEMVINIFEMHISFGIYIFEVKCFTEKTTFSKIKTDI